MSRAGVWNLGRFRASFCLPLGRVSGRSAAANTVLGRKGWSGENVSSRSPVHLNLPRTAGENVTYRVVSQRFCRASSTTFSSKVNTRLA